MVALVLGSGRLTAAVVLFAAVWAVTVVRRFSGDLALVRGDAERPEKVAVIAVWALTAILAVAAALLVAGDLRSYGRWLG